MANERAQIERASAEAAQHATPSLIEFGTSIGGPVPGSRWRGAPTRMTIHREPFD
jgi:hypothetical protein